MRGKRTRIYSKNYNRNSSGRIISNSPEHISVVQHLCKLKIFIIIWNVWNICKLMERMIFENIWS